MSDAPHRAVDSEPDPVVGAGSGRVVWNVPRSSRLGNAARVAIGLLCAIAILVVVFLLRR